MAGQKDNALRLTNVQFILMMTCCVVVWALAFPFISIALRELSYINLTIMRFLVVCIVFIIILLVQSKRFSHLQKRDIFPIFVLGFSGVMVYHLGLNYSEQYISASTASLFIATIPLFIVLLAVVFLHEKLTVKKTIGIILALFGVIVISAWGKQDATLEIHYISGAIAVLVAAIMGAVYTIAGKKLLERYSPLSLTIYAMLLGSLGLIPFITPSLVHEVTALSLNTWVAVLFLGVFSTVIGYAIWYVALEMKTASDLSVYLYCIPVLSTAISYVFLGEQITLLFVAGGVLVIIGLIIVNLKNNNSEP